MIDSVAKQKLIDIKEACLYVGIILLACGAAGWLKLRKALEK